jgi:KUP system potassium uptake protein
VIATRRPARGRNWLLAFLAPVLLLECVFFASNASKFMHGGWFPLALGAAIFVFTVLTTWRRGIDILRAKKEASADTIEDGLTLPLDGVPRVPGHAVFFSSSRTGCPGAFLHNLKHNHVVHETTVFLTVEFDDVPRVLDDERVEIQRGANGIARVIAHFGFREDPDIELVLRLAARKGLTLQVQSTSFFTSKPTVVSVSRRGIFGWRRSLFGWMLQNSASVASYFNLPPNRVVELGAQVGI